MYASLPWRWWARRDFVALAGAYALALILRFAVADSHPYTAEAAHFAVSGRLGIGLPRAYFLDMRSETGLAWLFWQRPLFHATLAPGAFLSFAAYRVLHVLLAALLAPAAIAITRAMGVGRGLAYGVGLVVAVHPLFVPWGTLALPDSLMTLALAAACLFYLYGHHARVAVALVAAAWIKEVALLYALGLLALSLVDGVRARTITLWPIRLDRPSSAAVAALALGPWPLFFSLALGGPFPGWGRGGDAWMVLERATLVPWVLGVLMVALAFPRTRRVAMLGLLLPVFYGVYRVGLGRAIEIWYYVAAGFFALVALAFVLHEAGQAARGHTPARAGIAGLALALGAILLVQVAVPDRGDVKDAAVAPLSGKPGWSLQQALDYEERRSDHLFDTWARLSPEQRQRPFAVDVDWSFVQYPMAMQADRAHYGNTEFAVLLQQELATWIRLLEEDASVTVVGVVPTPLNEAIRAAYADCTLAAFRDYVFFDAVPCADGGARLREAYRARLDAP